MERIDGICCDTCHDFPAVCQARGTVVEVIDGNKKTRQKVICSSCAYKLIFDNPITKRKQA